MKEIDFSGLDQYTYTSLRDSLQETFDDIIETYGIDIGMSIFEDVRQYIESEHEVEF